MFLFVNLDRLPPTTAALSEVETKDVFQTGTTTEYGVDFCCATSTKKIPKIIFSRIISKVTDYVRKKR